MAKEVHQTRQHGILLGCIHSKFFLVIIVCGVFVWVLRDHSVIVQEVRASVSIQSQSETFAGCHKHLETFNQS